jgi:hypothetical protein
MLFTYELQRNFERHNTDAIAVAAHPGVSNTGLVDHMPAIKLLRPLMELVAQSAAMGALPVIRAAVDSDVTGGQYYGPSGFMEFRGYPVVVQSSEASHDLADARRLWQVSEELTGVTFKAFDNATTE